MPELTFTAFVISLATTAAIHLGDIPDPATGQPSAPNLDAAKQMIDILALLEEKTRGNLTAEERKQITHFVDDFNCVRIGLALNGKNDGLFAIEVSN